MMAPEIEARKPYKGTCADLFALAVILFLLVTGHPPFHSATEQDKRFKSISLGQGLLFWKGVPETLSVEFKDLITSMFEFNPEDRLTMAALKSHSWMQGPVASCEEVKLELEERRTLFKAQSDQ